MKEVNTRGKKRSLTTRVFFLRGGLSACQSTERTTTTDHSSHRRLPRTAHRLAASQWGCREACPRARVSFNSASPTPEMYEVRKTLDLAAVEIRGAQICRLHPRPSTSRSTAKELSWVGRYAACQFCQLLTSDPSPQQDIAPAPAEVHKPPVTSRRPPPRHS